MPFFSTDLGIDLGTSNVLVYVDGKGVVIGQELRQDPPGRF